MKKVLVFFLCFTIILICSTSYMLLDTFVIEKKYNIEEVKESYEKIIKPNLSIYNNSVFNSFNSSQIDVKSNNSLSNSALQNSIDNSAQEINKYIDNDFEYSDGYINILVTKEIYNSSNLYFVDVKIKYQQLLKTNLAKNSSGEVGENVKQLPSDMAESCGAILAINGDYFGARSSGYVIRNSTIYRSNAASKTQEDLVFYDDGSCDIITEGSVSASELQSNGARHVWSFGPALIDNGEIVVDADDEVGQAKESNPRTCFGYYDKGHYAFVVSEGRWPDSKGLKLNELANYMASKGVKLAYNLDGGGSSVMIFNEKFVNRPTADGKTEKERQVSDIVYIGYDA